MEKKLTAQPETGLSHPPSIQRPSTDTGTTSMPTAAWEGHATISLSISDPSPDGNQEIIYTRGAGPDFSTQS